MDKKTMEKFISEASTTLALVDYSGLTKEQIAEILRGIAETYIC